MEGTTIVVLDMPSTAGSTPAAGTEVMDRHEQEQVRWSEGVLVDDAARPRSSRRGRDRLGAVERRDDRRHGCHAVVGLGVSLPDDHAVLSRGQVMAVPVLFRRDEVVPREYTAAGPGIPLRFPGKTVRQTLILVQLLGGPFLASYDAGLHRIVDLAPRHAPHVRLAWEAP